jgi:hypothetical protein
VQTPVLLLAFNRPEATRAVLRCLVDAGVRRLYVHCDAPRPNRIGEAQKVTEVRALIDALPPHIDIRRLYREQNIGLRDGIFSALNWVFAQEETAIVLEDDCVPDLSFFPYCTELLERYANSEQVMHIAGSNLAELHTENRHFSYLFSRFALVWGWATWRRAWAKMDIDMTDLDDFEQKGQISTLIDDPMAQTYMMSKFKATKRRENNSWAYAWSYSVLKNKGLCIVPKVNLIHNVGIGTAEATHTTKVNPITQRTAQPLQFPLQHPPHLQSEPAIEQQLFYVSQKPKWHLLRWFLLKKLGLRQ